MKGFEKPITGIFCHSLLDYIVLVTGEGEVHFWSLGTGKFVRCDSYALYGPIFALEKLLDQEISQSSDYNDFRVFKHARRNSISRSCAVLEYNSRYLTNLVNYQMEICKKSNNYLYELIGNAFQSCRPLSSRSPQQPSRRANEYSFQISRENLVPRGHYAGDQISFLVCFNFSEKIKQK